MTKVALICGTDLRQYAGLELTEELSLTSEYGEVSSTVFKSSLFNNDVYFMARHGVNSSIAPHQINYRANIDVLGQLGVEQIIAVNTVGGLHDSMAPGTWVCPEQIIDYTYGREQTFFDGLHKPMKHIDFSFPFAHSLRDSMIDYANQVGMPMSHFGTYAVTQGPRLETAAEVRRLQRDGCDLVGMTMMPEAVLARELDIGYCSLCLVANWGAGMEKQPLDIDAIYALVKAGFTDVVSFLSDYLKQLESPK
ncbi:S-methyl-5'-thioinosine phosphorylase [Pleionea litopenaei]|uniref:Purine nucleoside phosphorylase n=1 Tax=Pleionea litopenaei TaxID=3070815 RepID=A0AA51RWF8_9GAMM|nr:S-methyl-5'-thioinosine phosphorylase [Pleionea sp. HL-JVS1]WMS88842.1 S-methyl-5'-thioinosine phosphorylase [Pleionea sp. HL-JVS1]